MKKISTYTLLAFGLFACTSEDSERAVNLTYPETKKIEVFDEYFGNTIVDPYRWLEDDRSDETGDWVDAQNAVTFEYLAGLKTVGDFQARLTRLMDYPKESAPFREGGYEYFYRNSGLQNQSLIYRRDDQGVEELFLDPNKLSSDGTTSVAALSFSHSGSLAAYQISEGGADWRSVAVMDAKTLKVIDRIDDVKFSGLSWLGDEGFYYSRYDQPKGNELTAKTDQHKLYFHKVGEEQEADALVFGGDPNNKFRYVSGQVTEDQQYLIISGANSTSGNRLYVQNLEDKSTSIRPVVEDESSDIYVLTSVGDTLYAYTNRGADNGRVVSFSYAASDPTTWVDVIEETEHVLTASTVGGFLFAEYMIDAISAVKQFDLKGNYIRDIELPGPGSASGFSGKSDETTTFYSFTNYHTPSTIFELSLESGEIATYRESLADFEVGEYVSEQVFYTSKDGTRVPMIVTKKKGLPVDEPLPTMLYGYGGFDISLTPSFSSTMGAWMEAGGVYAVPNIRGGGEYGKDWHVAGTKLQKQNVFDDFIAAAEYLIEQGITDSDHLILRGGSNGGLLVGAVMTQRPELAAVALPAVGVLDMLRYHTFTAGAGWAYDYGTSEQSEEMFQYLLGYSPVHNVREGTNYPATLVTTGDHDDRVVPAHSFKFAAHLQEKHAGDNPVLIRIEKDAGHGAGTPTDKIVEQYAHIFAFAMENTGLSY